MVVLFEAISLSGIFLFMVHNGMELVVDNIREKRLVKCLVYCSLFIAGCYFVR